MGKIHFTKRHIKQHKHFKFNILSYKICVVNEDSFYKHHVEDNPLSSSISFCDTSNFIKHYHILGYCLVICPKIRR